MQKYQVYINGASADPSSNQWFESYNPFTGEPWALIPQSNEEDVDKAVRSAHAALTEGPWAAMTPSRRGLLLHKLGDLIACAARRLAEVEVRDNGKLIAEIQGQLDYMPQWYYYFGGLADKIQGAVIPLDKKGYFNFTRREPIGVVAVITPWNSPLLLASWKVAPALAAGCTVVIKPSEFTSASTLEFVRLFEEAGFPPGVVNVVTGLGQDVGVPLVEHPLVKKISFTRIRRHRTHHQSTCGQAFQARQSRTRRQVTEYRILGCELKRCGEWRHFWDICRHGADLYCWLSSPAAGRYPRRIPGEVAHIGSHGAHGRSDEFRYPGRTHYDPATVPESTGLHRYR